MRALNAGRILGPCPGDIITSYPSVKGHTKMLRNRLQNVALLVVTGTVALGLARSAPVAGQDEADTNRLSRKSRGW
jgi:hypothetical protein